LFALFVIVSLLPFLRRNGFSILYLRHYWQWRLWHLLTMGH